MAYASSVYFSCGFSMTKRPVKSIIADASLSGWPSQWQGPGCQTWPDYTSASWNELELEAVRRAILHFVPHLQGHLVTVLCDNMMVVAYINHQGGTRLPSLCSTVWNLLYLCRRNDLALQAPPPPRHSQEKQQRGRCTLQGESGPDRMVSNLASTCERLFHRMGCPNIDPFATATNAKLKVFCTGIFKALHALSINRDLY